MKRLLEKIGDLFYRASWWFTSSAWNYLFGNWHGAGHYTGILRRALCRFRGHPAGVWWFNPNGLEPDMHCKNCGDDLG